LPSQKDFVVRFHPWWSRRLLPGYGLSTERRHSGEVGQEDAFVDENQDRRAKATLLDALRGEATKDQLEADTGVGDVVFVVADPGQPLSDQAIEALARLLIQYDCNQHGFCRTQAA
jgi:hypothetical protein